MTLENLKKKERKVAKKVWRKPKQKRKKPGGTIYNHTWKWLGENKRDAELCKVVRRKEGRKEEAKKSKGWSLENVSLKLFKEVYIYIYGTRIGKCINIYLIAI